jgi:hypothetical protein
MKVVINTCFGGYTLSELAVKRYVELKGLKFFTDEGDDGTTKYYTIEVEKYKEELAEENRLFKEKSEKYHGHPSNRHCWNSCKIKRDDPVLVQVVEDLGSEANGSHAELLVVVIPDDVKYQIYNYDGSESIHEVHRSWP